MQIIASVKYNQFSITIVTSPVDLSMLSLQIGNLFIFSIPLESLRTVKYRQKNKNMGQIKFRQSQ